MTPSIKSRRSLAWTGWMAAVAAATLAVLLASAALAQASITLSPAGPYRNGARVTVTGSVPARYSTATHYMVSQCNLSAPPGTRCNLATASPLLPVATYASPGFGLTLVNRFIDYDFTRGSFPGTSTICRGRVGDQCGVVVDYWEWPARGTPTYLGSESLPIAF